MEITHLGPLVVLALIGTILGYLLASLRRKKPVWPTVSEEQRRSEYSTRNTVSVIVVIGFFATVFTIFSGMIDLTDATVAGFVGVIVGHVSNKLDPILRSLFGAVDEAPHDDDNAPR